MSRTAVETSLNKVNRELEELNRLLQNPILSDSVRVDLLTRRRQALRKQALLYMERNRYGS